MKMRFLQRKLLSIFALLLCFSAATLHLAGSTTYDFRTGTIITAGKSANDSLFLSGTYSLHGATYGLNMKVGGKIKVVVAGSSTIRFLGSVYSSLNIEGKTKSGVALEPNSKTTKVTTDLVDVIDFVYSGTTDTLTFTTVAPGSDLYLPTLQVIPYQMGGDAALSAAAKNIDYFFDLRDGSIIPTTTPGNVTLEQGLFKIESGPSNAYGYNGAQHGCAFKTGNKITLKVAGNSYIKIGGSIYSNGTISVSSATGSFDKTSQPALTSGNYGTDRSSVDFLYVGTAGTVVLDFTSTCYVPAIEIAPVPYAVVLNPWVVKTGIITVNGTDINLTAGANSSANANVTVGSGLVISATSTLASIRINLAGITLSTYTPAFSGDIASVAVSGDTLLVTYADASSVPNNYKIVVADNSIVAEAVAGQSYTYNFADASVIPQIGYASLRYPIFVTKDNLVTMNSNTATFAGQFGYHDNTHGAVMFPGNSLDITVAGNATINFITCQYGSAKDAIFEFKDGLGNVLGSCGAKDTTGVDGSPKSFTYTGAKGIITATLKSTLYPAAEVYIHGLSVENAAEIIVTKKTDVWDFGAEQLDTTYYNNKLDSAVINSWYAGTIVAGSAGNVLPGFTAGVLSWVGGSNDRLRTTNLKLTRYDANIGGGVGYTGRVYVNSAAATGRYMSLTLSEDDIVSVVTTSDAGGRINFQYVPAPASQTDVVTIPTTLDTLTFVAKAAGTYHIFDNLGKPSYFRIFRKDADYVTISGTVDETAAAGIPAGYGVNLKNSAGKTWNAIVTGGAFSVKVPVDKTYSLSLSDANGYIISNGNSLDVTSATTSYNVVIQKVDLFTVSGKITGIDTTNIKKMTLAYTPNPSANKIFVPSPVVNYLDSTYSVQLEPNCNYTISVSGLNDYYIPVDSIKIGSADASSDIAFAAKPVYDITIDATGITADQLAKLKLTFTNLNESGYVYNFSSVTGISLRDGTYTIAYTGLDSIPVQMGLTSNLKVNGAATSKALEFSAVTNWSFDDKAIPNGTTAYKGMLFTGTVASELAKGHLTAKSGATIKVPVKAGDKMRVTYYYTADFSIEGGTAITTATNSTTTFEFVDYTYTGIDAGFVTITVGAGAATTYITDIAIGGTVEYSPIIYVGTDKEYKSINEALAAIRKMIRNNGERVTVMIDPGNYEEMLVVDAPNITLSNAAVTPNIALLNKGVDIDAGAVRITSYYGHGYNYYSMKNNQKWDADVLRVNKENGYQTYANAGSGTTNGSYWNATVVVSASGFTANNIIFENSYNQYISKKESEDVVVMWTTGGKGIRPTDMGNTSVQNRSFVERAAAIAILGDKTILNKCRIVGRQDSYYGGANIRVANYKGAMMGAVDYIFGGMVAVFYKTDLVMNTSDVSGDQAYLTAAQQSTGRGYLMYECNVKSTIPGTETASANGAKPGLFGRPWAATTSEVVFFNTTIDASTYPGSEGKSLIIPVGWSNSLAGESNKMYEYGTVELSGENNQASRVSWSTVLSVPTLTDGTAITTLNFTKGTDGWDPFPDLIANDPTEVPQVHSISSVTVFPNPATEYITVERAGSKPAILAIYNLKGTKVLDKVLNSSTETIGVSVLPKGIYILEVDGNRSKLVVK